MKNLILLAVILVAMAQTASSQPVKVWEEELVIPTYLVEAPDRNPMFFQNQSYQGASRYIYPYALEDNITNKKVDKKWKAVYIENEYIKLCVLPEIGGRLFYATDKTNGYEIFYRQHVIKPANIGMLGAWISGGIEFCVFHHHRASTNIPVDCKTTQNADGSATIWIGETEPRHRMKWSLGISLYPGKSYIEVDGRLMNPTDQVNSILYWANVATHVNDDYQVIFPPSVDFAVYHAKNSFSHWPVTTETYDGKEHYQHHIDASWWKNHPEPVSFFAHDIQDGFLAGYDYGKKAGTMHVANHHIVKGAKLWEWGPGDYGAMWDSKVLTDSDGPYAELMAGAYSDNQPDYSWLKPYELKTFKQYWYPMRETEGAVAANLQAALNLKNMDKNKYLLAANTTQKHTGARIILLRNGKPVFEKTVDIAPEKPFAEEVQIENVQETELQLILTGADGNELISYQPVAKEKNLPLPEPVEPPAKPEEIGSNEELYLTGLRIKQFHNARIDPVPYFEEALKRDPFDTRSNTMMGIISKENFQMEKAAACFRKALVRLTANYTRPRNCEPFFHLGTVLQQQGKYDAAYDTLYRAAWDQDFASAAYYHLAQISCIRNEPVRALEEVQKSIQYNGANLPALNLQASLLRRIGKPEEAANVVNRVLANDPLNFRALNEQVMIGGDSEKLRQLMRDNPETYLELAVGYMNSGLNEEALGVLLMAVGSKNNRLNKYPTLHYYLGYLYRKAGNTAKASAHFLVAKEVDHSWCFPYRFETIGIYQSALEMNANDSRAHYYLGNLLYDKQPREAIEHWVMASRLEPTLAVAHRNVGWGYSHFHNDLKTAVAAYERAIKNDRTEPRFYYELDKLYEKNRTDPDKRLKLLTENHEYVSRRPDAFLQEIRVLSLAGRYGEAIRYLLEGFFPRQEGVDNLHEVYVDACLGEGINQLQQGNYSEALNYFTMADEYPENHQIGRISKYEKDAQIYWYQAQAYEGLKKRKEAGKLYDRIMIPELRNPEFSYYQALALKQSGKDNEALELASGIEKAGNELLQESGEVDFFSKFGGNESPEIRKSEGTYLLGLADLIRGNREAADTKFNEVITVNPNHLWARMQLKK